MHSPYRYRVVNMYPYGTLPYERARAIKLVQAIVDNDGRLQEGGEQYPNSLCLIDCAESLQRAVEKNTIDPTERKAYLDFSALLEQAWRVGLEGDRNGGISVEQLRDAVDCVFAAMPKIF
jgi:hypothetical protein